MSDLRIGRDSWSSQGFQRSVDSLLGLHQCQDECCAMSQPAYLYESHGQLLMDIAGKPILPLWIESSNPRFRCEATVFCMHCRPMKADV
jgi:hypothetical protein